MQQYRAGAWLIAIAATLWGSIGVVVALVFTQMPSTPLMIGALRLLFAVPVMWVWHRLVSGMWRIRMPRAHWYAIATAGVAFAGYQVTYFAAIPRIGVAMAVILNICSAPVFTLLLGWIFLAERTTPRQLVAMALAIVGVMVVVLGNSTSLPVWNIGIMYAVGAGLCYSSMAVASRHVAPHYAPVTVLTAVFGVSAVGLTASVVVCGIPLTLPTSAWYGVVYLALIPTVLSYVLYVRGLQHASATTATTLTLLEPLTSTICAVLFLGEQMAALAWLGTLIVIGGLGWYARLAAPSQESTPQ